MAVARISGCDGRRRRVYVFSRWRSGQRAGERAGQYTVPAIHFRAPFSGLVNRVPLPGLCGQVADAPHRLSQWKQPSKSPASN